MTPEPAALGRLQAYGLTENQAKAYMALVQLGEATASALNKVSGVPRNKVYSVVEELNEKGLVDIILEDPTVFRPNPIAAYLDRLVDELDGQRASMTRDRTWLETEFRIRDPPPGRDGQVGTFRLFKGRRAVLQQFGRMLLGCKSSARVLATAASAARMLGSGRLEDAPSLGREGGIQVDILTPLTPANVAAVGRLHARFGDRVRICYDTPPNLGVSLSDGREVMFTHFIPDSESLLAGDDIGVWTDNPVFLHLARDMLERASVGSRPFAAAKRMLATQTPPPRFDLVHDPGRLRAEVFGEILASRRADLVLTMQELGAGKVSLSAAETAQAAERVELVRLITDADPQMLLQQPWETRTEVRYLSPLPSQFAICDRRLVVRMYPLTEDAGPAITDRASLSVITDLAPVVTEAADHFESLWRRARPVLVAEAGQMGRPARHKES